MSPIIHLNYNLDTELLLEQAKEAKELSNPYTDSRYPDLKLDNWKIGHYTSDYIESIMADFEIEGRPRFYWLDPYAKIPEHIDNGTQCSLNFILTDNAAPITIESVVYEYKQVLLNTTLPHSVVNNEHERIMLKISIFDESFEQLAKRIKYVCR